MAKEYWPTITVSPGLTLFNVSSTAYEPLAFNPNTGGDPDELDAGGRFHPFLNEHGHRVATKYLADHPNGAFAETLMRDEMDGRALSLKAIRRHRLAAVKATRPLRLANLADGQHAPFIGRIFSGAEGPPYRLCRDLAATLHARMPEIDGMRWQGTQIGLPGFVCIVLFERGRFEQTRISAPDLELVWSEYLVKKSIRHYLYEAAQLRSVALPKSLVVEPDEQDFEG